jgi:hypothetical protein
MIAIYDELTSPVLKQVRATAARDLWSGVYSTEDEVTV